MSQPVTEISKPQNVTELYYVLIININKNIATLLETFRRNVNTIVSNLWDMILES
jgi:hypothetical protein